MNWVNALAKLNADGQAYALLTVLDTRGSSPRDAGAKMVVTTEQLFDTIGGGALEHEAISIARQLLSENPNSSVQHTQRFNLGKDLKQCCGGVVSVFFEVFPAVNFAINIFGAGHISQALLKILADVDCKTTLFDNRPELLKADYPAHIQTQLLDKPELAVEACAPNSYFLVMTHDHALDQQLCEAILSRGDSAYCGVIGSRTKGLKFKQRLLKKGFTQDELLALNCPMGLDALKSKKPMEIAVSLTTELLILRGQRNTAIHNKNNNNTIISLANAEKKAP